MGRLLTSRPVNKNASMNTLKLVWKLGKGVDIVAMEENLFLFKFASAEDRNRVLDGTPWSFDKNLLLFTAYDGRLQLKDYVFNKTTFWVRVYDLPLGMRNKVVAEKIGRKIGNLKAIDVSMESEGWARYLRIRVEVDIDKPLRRAILLRGHQGKEATMGRLKYERLPLFCMQCGLLGHGTNDCTQKENEGNSDESQQYGEWLKASPLKWKTSGSGDRKIINFMVEDSSSGMSKDGPNLGARRNLFSEAEKNSDARNTSTRSGASSERSRRTPPIESFSGAVMRTEILGDKGGIEQQVNGIINANVAGDLNINSAGDLGVNLGNQSGFSPSVVPDSRGLDVQQSMASLGGIREREGREDIQKNLIDSEV